MPAANDDYSLSLSVPAIAPHVDEVIVYVDEAADRTDHILQDLTDRFKNVRSVAAKSSIGWCNARNELMTLTDAQHLLFLDADDIFCEWQLDKLYQLPHLAKKADTGFVTLGLMEAVGDFRHGTGRGWVRPHYDKCHAYVKRSACLDLEWRHKDTFTFPYTAEKRVPCGSVLFLHAKGVKSDRRLVWRNTVRDRMRGKVRVAPPSTDIEHQLALQALLKSPQNPLLRKPSHVRLPEGLTNRFEIQYVGGVAVDRVDHGWHI
jgi:glycosyltransferase involved in cell wall biosynthesis